MTCPQCVENGEPSRVEMHTAVGSFGPIRPFEDHEGRLHLHDPTPATTHYSCSRGHSWAVDEATPCPVPGCGWEPPAP